MSLRLAAACIGGVVTVGSNGNAQAQGIPDLAVAISANPNPVVNRGPNDGFEVLIQVSNLAPPATITPFPSPGTPRAPPGTPPPPGIPPRPSPPQGAVVPAATIIFGTDLPMTASYGFVQLQSDPALNIRNCGPPSFGSYALRCTIGPLSNGGNWPITLVYRANAFPPGVPHTFFVTVDDGNQIAERNENNNNAGVRVDFRGTCAPTPRCEQDPATTDPRCQICYRDHCDGTGSVWHTC
jgi:hypothetical protein